MNRPILVDTDVMVEYLRGKDAAIAFVRKHADRIVLSSIVVAELYAGVRAGREETVLDGLVSVFRTVPVTAEIGRSAGLLKRDFGRSHGVGLADAVLAATARHAEARLATLNVRHYPMFKNLKPACSNR